MASKSNWNRMSMPERMRAANIDIMRHPEFCLLSGIVCMGQVHVVESDDPVLPMPTAGTDGLNCWYNREFMLKQSMEQVRWVVLHENFHKALKHCTHYTDLVKKYGFICNIAQDFAINGEIHALDPQQRFAAQPAGIQICFDEKYIGKSWIEVLRDLLKNAKVVQAGGAGSPGGSGGSITVNGETYEVFDEHKPGGTEGGMSPEQAKKLQGEIDQALSHGRIVQQKMAGKGGGNRTLDRIMAERRTDWREPLRQFFHTIVAGDDFSRFCPPNKRLLPLGFIMPSHFSESTGEVIVACDTSGSMGGIYPVVFGEIAQIAMTAKPERMRVIWWDGAVQGEQVFEPKDYEQIKKLMSPVGGGGTTPHVVVDYIREKRYKPKAVVWLTDGYLDGSGSDTHTPQLWGVVDNQQFVPPQGKVIHIDSLTQ